MEFIEVFEFIKCTLRKMKIAKRRFFILLIVSTCFYFLLTCTKKKGEKSSDDTPTSGSISIAVDESLRLLFESEVHTFEHIYTNAKINVFYVSEQEAIDLLIKDSVRLAIVTRTLSHEEQALLEKQKIAPHQVKVAIDAIGMIVNKANKDTCLSYQTLTDLLKGHIPSWKNINSKSKLGNITIVFDHASSGTFRFVKDSILKGDTIPSNFFALKTNLDVLKHVEENKNAVGIIGISWISDKDDSTSLHFSKKINVLGFEKENECYQPYQAYIAEKKYPLLRHIYIVSREARTGLGSGFIAFVSSDKGQRIVLKLGLLPATMPIRVVNLNQEEL